MKKLLMGLIVVILLGSAVSILYRFTGINLENGYKISTIIYVTYTILKEYDCRKTLYKINMSR
jgi:hypothetical protein